MTCFETQSIHMGGMKDFAYEDILPQKLNDLSKAMYLLLRGGTMTPSLVFFLVPCTCGELSQSFKPNSL